MILPPLERRKHPPAREKLQRELHCLSQKSRRVADGEARHVGGRETEQRVESSGRAEADHRDNPRVEEIKPPLRAVIMIRPQEVRRGLRTGLGRGQQQTQVALDERAWLGHRAHSPQHPAKHVSPARERMRARTRICRRPSTQRGSAGRQHRVLTPKAQSGIARPHRVKSNHRHESSRIVWTLRPPGWNRFMLEVPDLATIVGELRAAGSKLSRKPRPHPCLSRAENPLSDRESRD